MKKIFSFILFINLVNTGFAQKIKLELQFFYKENYCGGIKPNPEILAQSEQNKPLSNYKLYVYIKNKCVDSLTTNDSGIVTTNLKSGTYILLEAWKHFKKTPDGALINNYDKACLKKEYSKANYTLTLKTATNFNLQQNNELIIGKCPHQYPCLLKRHYPQ